MPSLYNTKSLDTADYCVLYFQTFQFDSKHTKRGAPENDHLETVHGKYPEIILNGMELAQAEITLQPWEEKKNREKMFLGRDFQGDYELLFANNTEDFQYALCFCRELCL